MTNKQTITAVRLVCPSVWVPVKQPLPPLTGTQKPAAPMLTRSILPPPLSPAPLKREKKKRDGECVWLQGTNQPPAPLSIWSVFFVFPRYLLFAVFWSGNKRLWRREKKRSHEPRKKKGEKNNGGQERGGGRARGNRGRKTQKRERPVSLRISRLN